MQMPLAASPTPPVANAKKSLVTHDLTDPNAWIERLTPSRYVKVHARFDTLWFRHLAQNPDTALDAPWTKLLKHDLSTTVGLTSFDGQLVVIKRYNPRNPVYACKRLLRISRASHCARASSLFSQANITTPHSVAVIEKRFGLFKGTSYYLMLYSPGILLSDWFTGVTHIREQDTPVLDAVRHTFERLQQHNLYHGDMKSTNLLWQNDRLVLLDLDAARHCGDSNRLQQRLSADKARFLKNFAQHPQLQGAIKQRLAW